MPTLLVPLEYDRTKPQPHGVSELAIPWARLLAERLVADVVLISALEVPVGLKSLRRQELLQALLEDWRQQCRTYLEGIAQQDFQGARSVRVVVEEAEPAFLLARYAVEVPDPLVVMAVHARAGWQRLVLGSVTAQVIANAVAPVFVIPAHLARPSGPISPLDRVLVPLDGSRLAEKALELLPLLGSKGWNIVLLHVREGRARQIEAEVAGDAPEVYLAMLAETLTRTGYQVTWLVADGRPTEVIVRVAREQAVDLIALITHGWSGLRDVVLGSTAEQVLAATPVPILVRRPQRLTLPGGTERM